MGVGWLRKRKPVSQEAPDAWAEFNERNAPMYAWVVSELRAGRDPAKSYAAFKEEEPNK